MYCEKCGASNEEGAKFCEKCGAAVSDFGKIGNDDTSKEGKMNEMLAFYKAVLQKYAVFEGRAGKAEYWYFVLVNMLVYLGLLFFGEFPILGIFLSHLAFLYYLAIIIPSLAVSVRRLHDIGKSGWFLLLVLIPIVGVLWVIFLMATDGQAGDNKYGKSLQ